MCTQTQQYNRQIAFKAVLKAIPRILKGPIDTTELALELVAEHLITSHFYGEILDDKKLRGKMLHEVAKAVQLGENAFSTFLKALQETEGGRHAADYCSVFMVCKCFTTEILYMYTIAEESKKPLQGPQGIETENNSYTHVHVYNSELYLAKWVGSFF